jgi:hypothetical protein
MRSIGPLLAVKAAEAVHVSIHDGQRLTHNWARIIALNPHLPQHTRARVKAHHVVIHLVKIRGLSASVHVQDAIGRHRLAKKDAQLHRTIAAWAERPPLQGFKIQRVCVREGGLAVPPAQNNQLTILDA